MQMPSTTKFEIDDTPIEVDILLSILTMLPQLKAFYAALTDLTADWKVNEMSEKIAAALAAGQPLAGYSPAFFLVLGLLFADLERWMTTPIDVPPEAIAALGVKQVTPEVAIRMRWLSEAAKTTV